MALEVGQETLTLDNLIIMLEDLAQDAIFSSSTPYPDRASSG
jgi:hypothetical protein